MQNDISTFSDHVVIKQGSIDIRADKVVLAYLGGDQRKTYIEAFGNPVTFSQIQEGGKLIKGHAQKIRYDIMTQIINLSGNAYLEQLNSNVTGDHISYLFQKQTMQAFSDIGKHVTTLLVPEHLQDKEKHKSK